MHWSGIDGNKTIGEACKSATEIMFIYFSSIFCLFLYNQFLRWCWYKSSEYPAIASYSGFIFPCSWGLSLAQCLQAVQIKYFPSAGVIMCWWMWWVARCWNGCDDRCPKCISLQGLWCRERSGAKLKGVEQIWSHRQGEAVRIHSARDPCLHSFLWQVIQGGLAWFPLRWRKKGINVYINPVKCFSWLFLCCLLWMFWFI